MKERRRAFSLIEMMMVILIIGILMAGFLISPILRSIKAAKVRRAETEMKTIAVAIRSYRYEYSLWPCIASYTYDPVIFSTSPKNADVIKEMTDSKTNPKNISFINLTEYTLDTATSNLLNPVTLLPYNIAISGSNDTVSVY